MKNRIFALLLCAVLLFSALACTDEKVNTSTEPDETTQAPTLPEQIEGYDKVEASLLDFGYFGFEKAELTKGYEALDTDEQRECYKLIDDYILYIAQEKTDEMYKVHPIDMKGITLSEAELHLVISAFSMDHPEIFWLQSKFAYYTTHNQTFLQLNSAFSAREISACAVEMKSAVEEIFDGISADMSEYRRELYLHDALIERCEYADNLNDGEDNFRVYTSLGGLVDGYAVCEGYSRAMQVLLSSAGIQAYYVLGIGNEELHMWNTVKIDNEWYYLDVTWNDNESYGANYDYFNLTTDQALDSRTISPLYWELTEDEICGKTGEYAANFNMFVPECVVKDWGFYQQRSITVTGFDRENLNLIAQAFTDAVNNSETAVYLYLDPQYLDYDEAVDNLFYGGDYAIFSCLSIANGQLANTKIKEDYVTTEESPEYSVVTVYIEY